MKITFNQNKCQSYCSAFWAASHCALYHMFQSVDVVKAAAATILIRRSETSLNISVVLPQKIVVLIGLPCPVLIVHALSPHLHHLLILAPVIVLEVPGRAHDGGAGADERLVAQAWSLGDTIGIHGLHGGRALRLVDGGHRGAAVELVLALLAGAIEHGRAVVVLH